VGVELRLDDFDRIGSHVPLLLNLQPTGQYLMDDLHRAGGLLAVLREVQDLLDPTAVTVTGKPLVDYLPDAQIWDADVIRRRDAPLQDNAGIAVLHGTLAPDGAVIKPAAASKELLVHRGRAVMFDSIEELHARLDDPDLDIDETCVLVLRGCGPKGYPGMPEAANTPIPPTLLARGVRDLIRISDARMSGTAYGTVVLHVSPESAAGGPLSLVRNGDMIILDVPGDGWTSTFPRRSYGSGNRPKAPKRPTASRSAAGSASTSTTSCRPTRGQIWTSSSDPAATR
jgi:dihydroxy-acid dehydratase